jgi:predicted nucleotide-binding protein (sugar kinase/HSP70/actin superfamily)
MNKLINMNDYLRSKKFTYKVEYYMQNCRKIVANFTTMKKTSKEDKTQVNKVTSILMMEFNSVCSVKKK